MFISKLRLGKSRWFTLQDGSLSKKYDGFGVRRRSSLKIVLYFVWIRAKCLGSGQFYCFVYKANYTKKILFVLQVEKVISQHSFNKTNRLQVVRLRLEDESRVIGELVYSSLLLKDSFLLFSI